MASQAPEMLRELIEELGYPIFQENGRLRVPRAALRVLGEELSELADQKQAWGWRYLRNVLNAKQDAGARLIQAILEWGAVLDGAPAVMANTQDMQVRAREGQLHPGAVVLGESVRCKYSGCRVAFVPRVPWQSYCSAESEEKMSARKYRKTHKQLAEELIAIIAGYFEEAADQDERISQNDAIAVLQAEALLAIEEELERIADLMEFQAGVDVNKR